MDANLGYIGGRLGSIILVLLFFFFFCESLGKQHNTLVFFDLPTYLLCRFLPIVCISPALVVSIVHLPLSVYLFILKMGWRWRSRIGLPPHLFLLGRTGVKCFVRKRFESRV